VQQLGSSSDGGRERRRADGALPRTLRRLRCAHRRRLCATRCCGELGVATGLGSECLLQAVPNQVWPGGEVDCALAQPCQLHMCDVKMVQQMDGVAVLQIHFYI
jgi:hypothetical protein